MSSSGIPCIESTSAFMIHPSDRGVTFPAFGRYLVVVSKASSVRERRLSVRLALTRLEKGSCSSLSIPVELPMHSADDQLGLAMPCIIQANL